jgi:hypothetical protein
MANVRVWCKTAKTLTHPSGRSYTVTAGGTIDISEAEAEYFDWRSQGFVLLGGISSNPMRVGTTGNRPTITSARPPRLGDCYYDTSLTEVVFFAGPENQPGGIWVNASGSTV